MPSSPDPVPVLAWELIDLDRAGAPPTASPHAGAPAFVPAEGARARLIPFEVGGSAGIPDSLLAPARAEARAAGYLAGWSQGRQDAEERAVAEERARAADLHRAEQERAARFERAMSSLDRAAAQLEGRATPGATEVEGLIIGTALQIAEALVGHSLRHDGERAESALARVLDLAPQGEPVVVRLNPADHALLTGGAAPAAAPGRAVTLVPDASLQPGDAVATSGATEIDGRIAAGLARVREVLGR